MFPISSFFTILSFFSRDLFLNRLMIIHAASLVVQFEYIVTNLAVPIYIVEISVNKKRNSFTIILTYTVWSLKLYCTNNVKEILNRKDRESSLSRTFSEWKSPVGKPRIRFSLKLSIVEFRKTLVWEASARSDFLSGSPSPTVVAPPPYVEFKKILRRVSNYSGIIPDIS